MITISDIKDWLKLNIDCPNWYSGALRDTKSKAIVIYNGKSFVNPVAIGGADNSSYRGKGIRVLINWNKNISDSEIKALEVYVFLRSANHIRDLKIKGKRVIQIVFRDPEPIFLGVDSSGNYEYVIDLEIIIER